jgi:hypothetical protein
VLFNGPLQGKLQVMKIEMGVVLDVLDDSDEKVEIKHANYFKIYHANEFISFFEFC